MSESDRYIYIYIYTYIYVCIIIILVILTHIELSWSAFGISQYLMCKEVTTSSSLSVSKELRQHPMPCRKCDCHNICSVEALSEINLRNSCTAIHHDPPLLPTKKRKEGGGTHFAYEVNSRVLLSTFHCCFLVFFPSSLVHVRSFPSVTVDGGSCGSLHLCTSDARPREPKKNTKQEKGHPSFGLVDFWMGTLPKKTQTGPWAPGCPSPEGLLASDPTGSHSEIGRSMAAGKVRSKIRGCPEEQSASEGTNACHVQGAPQSKMSGLIPVETP